MTPETVTGIIVCSLAIVSAMAKAVGDTIQHHIYQSIFARKNPQYWNPSISWMNKYKKRTFEYEGKPKEIVTDQPAFWLSTTWLVWLTDAAHLADALRRLFSIGLLAILYLSGRVDWIGTLDVWWLFAALAFNYGVFHVCYTYLFVAKPVASEQLRVATSHAGYFLNNLSGAAVVLVVGVAFTVPALLGVLVNPYLGAGVAGAMILATALAEPIKNLFK